MKINKPVVYQLIVIFITVLLLYLYVSQKETPIIVDFISVIVFAFLGGLLADLSSSAKKSKKNKE